MFGREAAVDFTHCTELGVTIAGRVLRHLLFQLVLSFSGWRSVSLAFGETYEALVAGVQAALWALRGVPEVLRSDNLSAATHELVHTGGRTLTVRFRAVLDHYGLVSTCIRPGESHENGVVEQAHHRLKSALAQALIVRGSKDFASIETYMAFVDGVVEKKVNRPAAAKLEEVAVRPRRRTEHGIQLRAHVGHSVSDLLPCSLYLPTAGAERKAVRLEGSFRAVRSVLRSA